MLEGRADYADLYRTITAGPSGQRSDLHVARVRPSREYGFDVQIVSLDGPFAGEVAGYGTRTPRNGVLVWAIHEQPYNDRPRLRGWADTLSVGCDVLMYGRHAALDNHDHRRISRGHWEPYDADEAYRRWQKRVLGEADRRG